MVYEEIVHTCSNANVARAALASIGGEFARDFAADASRREMTSGDFAARLVRAFAQGADEVELRGVSDATHGADLPILSGLRYILEHARRDGGPYMWQAAARSRSAA
jgi:hypothetical protein